MRKLAVILAPLIILAITLALVGCGGEESPTPTPSPTQAPTATPAKTATPAATPTAAPTATPAPPLTVTPVGANPPCRFYGTVKLNGANVADDTVITAIISGDEFTTETPEEVYGTSTYAIKIVPPQGASYSEGAIISFKIGNYTANQTGSWETGGNIELNLTASTTT